MGFISARKVWSRVALVMADMVVVALVGCQGHAASHEQILSSPAGYHYAPSPHRAFDHPSLVARRPFRKSYSSARLPGSTAASPLLKQASRLRSQRTGGASTTQTANLPIVAFPLPVYLCTPYTTDQVAHPTGCASPPFIPS